MTAVKPSNLRDGAEVAIGDLLNPDSLRSALKGVEKLVPGPQCSDELTQALLTVALARHAMVKHITYLSVYHAERFPHIPYFHLQLAKIKHYK